MERFRLQPEAQKTKNLLLEYRLGMPIRGLRYIGMGKALEASGYYQKQILRITLRMTDGAHGGSHLHRDSSNGQG
jgi:hypothetical protein